MLDWYIQALALFFPEAIELWKDLPLKSLYHSQFSFFLQKNPTIYLKVTKV